MNEGKTHMPLPEELTAKESKELLKKEPASLTAQEVSNVVGLLLKYFAKATKAENSEISSATSKRYLTEFSKYSDYLLKIMDTALRVINDSDDPFFDIDSELVNFHIARGGADIYSLLNAFKLRHNELTDDMETQNYTANLLNQQIDNRPQAESEEADTAYIRPLMAMAFNAKSKTFADALQIEVMANLVLYIATVTDTRNLNAIAKSWYTSVEPYVDEMLELKIDPPKTIKSSSNSRLLDMFRKGSGKRWHKLARLSRKRNHIISLMTPVHAASMNSFEFEAVSNVATTPQAESEATTLRALLYVLGLDTGLWKELIWWLNKPKRTPLRQGYKYPTKRLNCPIVTAWLWKTPPSKTPLNWLANGCERYREHPLTQAATC